ncbi:MAG: phosphatidylserine decarboxylase [Methanobacteriota archaeon]
MTSLILLYLSILIIFCVSLFIFWRYFFFFRKPSRTDSYEKDYILSPADGFIIYCKKIEPGQDIFSIKNYNKIRLNDLMFIDDKNLLNQSGWLIGIFMTFFDVHYNTAPITGHILKINHDFPSTLRKNRNMLKVYKNFLLPIRQWWKNCEYIITNERASYIIKNERVSVYITQIADSWINKIVTYKNNEQIEQGEIFGLIRMGSQVDIFIPDKNDTIEILVKERHRVKAGITKLASLNKNGKNQQINKIG